MNDTFNLTRFGWLFKKTVLERPVQLLGLAGLTLVISLLFYAILKDLLGFDEAQNLSFIFGLVGGGGFLASVVFNYFSSNASGSSYLTLPASHFEKWLCGVIITGILFTCIFLAFYYFMDLAFVRLYHDSLDPKDPYFREKYDAVNKFPLGGFVAGKAYIMFLNAACAMLVGSLYFNKAGFIKVALIVCALYIGGHLLNYVMAKVLFDAIDKALPYYCVFIPVGRDVGKVLLPAYASTAVDICLIYIVPGILLLAAYVRIREKEF